jgi:hypothetical protein
MSHSSTKWRRDHAVCTDGMQSHSIIVTRTLCIGCALDLRQLAGCIRALCSAHLLFTATASLMTPLASQTRCSCRLGLHLTSILFSRKFPYQLVSTPDYGRVGAANVIRCTAGIQFAAVSTPDELLYFKVVGWKCNMSADDFLPTSPVIAAAGAGSSTTRSSTARG